MSKFEIVCQPHTHTGESITWSEREQALYWVDIPVGKIYRWHDAQGLTSWQTDTAIGCVLLHQSKALIGCQTHFINRLKPEGDSLGIESAYQIPHSQKDMRINDGCADRQGRLWFGSMQQDNDGSRIGVLYRLANHQLSAQIEGLYTPNGLSFSPDGKVMYLSDSHPQTQIIWAFDYDTDEGVISKQRVFVDMKQYAGRPDGATVDSEGCYWICGIDSGLIHRFSPKGQLIHSYPVPVKKPTKCVFGGGDLRTLFVTSITPQDSLQQTPDLDGAIFAVNLDVQGIADTVLSADHV